MQISGSSSTSALGSGLRIRSSNPSAQVGSSGRGGSSLLDFAKDVVELGKAHKSLLQAARFSKARGARKGASTSSAISLNLNIVPTSTTLRSTEEINTIPTSYSTREPIYAGSSTADATLGGIYDGSNGDTTLTFTATSGGDVGGLLGGLFRPSFEVRDSNGTLVDTIDIENDPPGTEYALSNGLNVAFEAGSVTNGDSFQVDVSASVGSSVQTGNAFNGSLDAAPGFDPGFSVTAGSFEINGETIAVQADDTLVSVLNRISASAAGVVATFDSATEQILLTQNTPGPDEDIVLGADDSGFLAAVKLSGATTVPGETDGRELAIDQVDAFSSIQTGSFTINGVQLQVDVSTDSLQDLIDSINEADVGARASFDASTGRFRIRATGSGDLELDDGSSGVFTGLEVETGEFMGTKRGSSTSFLEPSKLVSRMEDFTEAYNKIFDTTYTGFGKATVTGVRKKLESAIAGTFDSILGKKGDGSLRSSLGVQFVVEGKTEGRKIELSLSSFAKTADKDAGELIEFLFDPSSRRGEEEGLLTRLDRNLESSKGLLENVLGREAIGLNLDVLG